MQKRKNSARRWSVQFLESFKLICSSAQNNRLMTNLFQYILDSTSCVWPIHAPPDVVNYLMREPVPLSFKLYYYAISLYSAAIHLNDLNKTRRMFVCCTRCVNLFLSHLGL